MVALPLLCLLASPPVAAQDGEVVPGPQYEAGGLHRFYFGSGWRELWTTPITLEILDLQTFGGGLTPTGVGGGQQTRALRFVGGDGRSYTFRPLQKSLLDILPEYMRGTFLEDVAEDQISSAHPTAPPVVAVLLEALDVPHASPTLVILPDDPALGEYREEFAGMAGTIEEWPNEGEEGAPGFAGATNVVGTEELIEILEGDQDQRIDAYLYLTARLVDFLVGDWDRHHGQFRWANTGEGSPPGWLPIPEDRDQAFVRYDGVFLGAARVFAPQLINFDEDFGQIIGISWNGRDMDRRFLVGFSESVFESVAVSIQERLTDEVIDGALREMPAEHYDLVGRGMGEVLRHRRAGLGKIAGQFYHHLAGEVDIHGTDEAEIFEITREDLGFLDVSVFRTDEGARESTPYLHRRFNPGETDDLRLYLHGGDDRVTIRGDGENTIGIRVVSGEGDDRVEDGSRAGGTRVYDDRKEGGVPDGTGLKLIRRQYSPPPHPPGQLPPSDWGSRTRYAGSMFVSGELGFYAAVGLIHERYGFRKQPFSYRIVPYIGFSTSKTAFRFDLDSEGRLENSRMFGRVSILASGIESVNFFGFGNETPLPADEDSADVEQNLLRLEPSIGFDISSKSEVTIGFPVLYSTTEKNENTVVGLTTPYGSQDLWQAGVRGEFELDTRDQGSASRSGAQILLNGGYYPDAFDLVEDFGWVEGDVKWYYSPVRKFTFAARVGGKKLWGDLIPYYEAAYIGGNANVRGFAVQRFAGDASLFGSLELRLELTRFFILLPGQGGLFGLVDSGRVWFDGEDSKKWHTGYGGGIWIAPLVRANTFSFAIAKSDEDTRMYFVYGFNF